MDKNIKDYLHYYLGCEVMLLDKYKCKLVGFERGCPVVENLGYPLWARFHTVKVNEFGMIKPILRLRHDMTEDEINECWRLLDWTDRIVDPESRRNCLFYEYIDTSGWRQSGWVSFTKILPFLLSIRIDVFGLIEAGLAIDKTNNWEN